MTRRDPIFPNAGIVARREYRDRTRSRLFRLSTLVLMVLALAVAMAPITLRYLDRSSVQRILVVAAEEALARSTVLTADGIMNIPPAGTDAATWTAPYRIERASDLASAMTELAAGRVAAILEVDRAAGGALQVVYRTGGPANGVLSQLAGFTALSVGILDWTSSLPPGSALGAFQTPEFRTESLNVPTERGRAVDAVQVASRSFLGTVFIVLMFITILIYGMWVATGVATEKSSRVMELMISAASPRQLLTGKVVGIGLAGLTQYVAIALPALGVLAVQDR
ncbi:MAG: ABC transporter permease, partial [Chloroflexi bacterium]|nr:ABC transporter permease [Chloroflexota bacterium]